MRPRGPARVVARDRRARGRAGRARARPPIRRAPLRNRHPLQREDLNVGASKLGDLQHGRGRSLRAHPPPEPRLAPRAQDRRDDRPSAARRTRRGERRQRLRVRARADAPAARARVRHLLAFEGARDRPLPRRLGRALRRVHVFRGRQTRVRAPRAERGRERRLELRRREPRELRDRQVFRGRGPRDGAVQGAPARPARLRRPSVRLARGFELRPKSHHPARPRVLAAVRGARGARGRHVARRVRRVPALRPRALPAPLDARVELLDARGRRDGLRRSRRAPRDGAGRRRRAGRARRRAGRGGGGDRRVRERVVPLRPGPRGRLRPVFLRRRWADRRVRRTERFRQVDDRASDVASIRRRGRRRPHRRRRRPRCHASVAAAPRGGCRARHGALQRIRRVQHRLRPRRRPQPGRARCRRGAARAAPRPRRLVGRRVQYDCRRARPAPERR
mmetsp:Transcript_28164/g.87403  ORF Transcript_28164/g.87403 Transcript_28164/m.87403 type:complete len:449 (+) Transcript_28164:355-1701(+)